MGTSDMNSDAAKEKRRIRRGMKRERSELPSDQKRSWDRAITYNLLGSDLFRDAGCIYCYYSTEEEADTTELIQSALYSGKSVACPRVEKGGINFYYIKTLSDCCPGFRGICEPSKNCEKADDKESLLILPGLAFSMKGERIGYGGGYYDRFLAAEPQHATAALAYPFQVLAALPCEENDFKTEYIITPDGINMTTAGQDI